MCLICVEWNKGKMTTAEALNALGEMVNTDSEAANTLHYSELLDKILEENEEQSRETD